MFLYAVPMAKRGPAPKGTRSQVTFRAPIDQLQQYRILADQAGLPLGDYLALQLARAHNLPEPAYLRRPSDHPRLPISA